MYVFMYVQAEPELARLYSDDWHDHPGLARAPVVHDIAEQPPPKKSRAEASQTREDEWEEWAQGMAASFTDGGTEAQTTLDEPAELVELEVCGEAVTWPAGWSEHCRLMPHPSCPWS